jgi:hypothetical protein
MPPAKLAAITARDADHLGSLGNIMIAPVRNL